jgi:hypothetical protein
MDDFFGELDTDIPKDLIQIDDLFELYNSEVGSRFIIVDNKTNNFLLATLVNKENIKGINDVVRKTKESNTARFIFIDEEKRTFILNKFFRGNIEDWGDDGGEIFSTYRIFKLNTDLEIDKITDLLTPLIKNKAIYKVDMPIVNLPPPKPMKYKNKYYINY